MPTSLTSPAAVFTADKAIIAARKALAKSRLFTTDFSQDAVAPGTTLKVPVFTAGSAVTFNASSNNYEDVEGSVTYVPVSFSHIKNTFAFTDSDFLLANGTNFWENAGKASGGAIAQGIEKEIGDLLTTTSITTKHVMSSVTKANIAKLREECATAGADPSKCVVMLSPAYFATLLSTLDANIYGGAQAIRDGIVEGLYGFKAVVEFSQFPAATTLGAVIPEDGIALAGRTVTVKSPKIYEEIGLTTDELSGMTLGIRRHGDPATGTNFMTVEAMVGAALTQASKCFYIAAS